MIRFHYLLYFLVQTQQTFLINFFKLEKKARDFLYITEDKYRNDTCRKMRIRTGTDEHNK